MAHDPTRQFDDADAIQLLHLTRAIGLAKCADQFGVAQQALRRALSNERLSKANRRLISDGLKKAAAS
ncbi:MAG: hypothetical protein U0414_42540 [Polyangiaceae bacterium]